MVYILSLSVDNSRVSLVAASKDLSNTGHVLSMPRKCFIAFTLPNLFLNVFGARNPPVCSVKEIHFSPP